MQPYCIRRLVPVRCFMHLATVVVLQIKNVPVTRWLFTADSNARGIGKRDPPPRPIPVEVGPANERLLNGLLAGTPEYFSQEAVLHKFTVAAIATPLKYYIAYDEQSSDTDQCRGVIVVV
ncbi:hypothetical protein EVAR_1026_1 [Eumeta japonica]|uniref:Uncharacterized protein n=1 Tax=Eumeta variegata TaxID=151549 RepID=A0A4C1SEG5_EUMVA|nr:hypothetical protein EVAR_1026_1 [Eumeta japonica]